MIKRNAKKQKGGASRSTDKRIRQFSTVKKSKNGKKDGKKNSKNENRSVGKSLDKRSLGKDGQNGNDEMKPMPQNFNSYRHVITTNTTGDDIKWVLGLRDSSKKSHKVPASTAGPFGFADKLTESLKNHKTAKEFDNIGNPYDVDHLTRKRIGPSHANYATGYFESGLRKPRHFRVNKLHKKQFYRYGKVDRKEMPTFMHRASTQKGIKHKIKALENDIEKLDKPIEKFRSKRKLPKLFYSAFEGRYEEAPLEFYEARNKKNINMQMSEHLYKQGEITTLKWEISLRQRFQNPWKKRKRDDNKGRDRLSMSMNRKKRTRG